MKLADLRRMGFDRSEHEPFTKYFRVRCSQCESVVVNGIPCHERNCPNQPNDDESEEEL